MTGWGLKLPVVQSASSGRGLSDDEYPEELDTTPREQPNDVYSSPISRHKVSQKIPCRNTGQHPLTPPLPSPSSEPKDFSSVHAVLVFVLQKLQVK